MKISRVRPKSRARFDAACIAIVCVVALCGCTGNRTRAKGASAPAPPASLTNTNRASLVITPSASPVGKVASVNTQGKFVVISFPIGQLPALNTRFSVYHGVTKVGEVKVTGPSQDNLTVADIVAGTAQENDEVRAD